MKNKLDFNTAQDIRWGLKHKGATVIELAAEHGVNRSTIYNIKWGRIYKVKHVSPKTNRKPCGRKILFDVGTAVGLIAVLTLVIFF